MKKIILIILCIISINIIGCSNKNISNSDINKMKKVIEKVLFYEKSYDSEIGKYIDEETFNECNYEILYSYLIGKVKFVKYESKVKSVLKKKDKYIICMILNMEARANELQSDGTDEGYDYIEGKDVPLQIVLEKQGKSYVIKDVKEYTSLEEAENQNKEFKKNK